MIIWVTVNQKNSNWYVDALSLVLPLLVSHKDQMQLIHVQLVFSHSYSVQMHSWWLTDPIHKCVTLPHHSLTDPEFIPVVCSGNRIVTAHAMYILRDLFQVPAVVVCHTPSLVSHFLFASSLLPWNKGKMPKKYLKKKVVPVSMLKDKAKLLFLFWGARRREESEKRRPTLYRKSFNEQ